MLHLLSAKAFRAGQRRVLWLVGSAPYLQLRDSAGLSPAFPVRPSHPGCGSPLPSMYSIVAIIVHYSGLVNSEMQSACGAQLTPGGGRHLSRSGCGRDGWCGRGGREDRSSGAILLWGQHQDGDGSGDNHENQEENAQARNPHAPRRGVQSPECPPVYGG